MDQFGGAGASVGVVAPGNVSVTAEGTHGDSAQASYTTTYQLLVTNGVGSGLFEPCFDVLSAISGGSASASFGRVAAFRNEVLCGGPPVLALDTTPFVFGVPQTDQLTMMALGGGFSGGGFASWSGFEVFDSSGNQLASAVVSLIDITVPEPGFLAPLTTLLALLGVCCATRDTRRVNA